MGIWTNDLHVWWNGNMDKCVTCLPRWAFEHMFYMFAEMGIWTNVCRNGHMNTCLPKWTFKHMFAEMGIWTHACRNEHMNTCLPKWAYEHMFVEMGIWTHVCGNGHINKCLPKWAYEHMFSEMGTWTNALPRWENVLMLCHKWQWWLALKYVCLQTHRHQPLLTN